MSEKSWVRIPEVACKEPTVNSIETKWQLIAIVVVLNYAKIDARIHRINPRGGPSTTQLITAQRMTPATTDHRTQLSTALP